MTLSDYGISIKNTGKTICPKCSNDRKNKSDKCLSVDVEHGIWNCHNCGWKGTLKKQKEVKVYEKPIWVNNTNLSDKVVEWFKKRGISQQTLIDFKIAEILEWMPQVERKSNCLAFPYFRGEECLNVKFRDGAKNFKLVKGAELVFFNLNAVSETIIITEGEIDCMSFHEVGIKNVISVPNGASKGNSKLEYLDNCFEIFESKQVIIATDNDEAGINLRNELARRIGIDTCTYIDFEDCKDANEFLVKHGSIALSELINKKKDFPISGVIYAKDIYEDIDDLYYNGFPKLKTTGINEFDELIKFEDGALCMVTGIPNHGKSEFIDFITCKMLVKNDYRLAVFSPENFPLKYHFSKLAEKIIGKRFNGHDRMNELEKEKAKGFVNDNVFFIRPDDDNFSIDNILDKARLLVKKHGIKVLIIDPYNRLEHQAEKGISETNYISKLLDKIITFKQKYAVTIFLIAHPTKIKKDKVTSMYEIPNLYDISGSANFFNKADVGISVYRNFNTNMTEVYIQKVRFKHWGKIGFCEFMWNEKNGRYINDESNWLDKQEQVKIEYKPSFYEVDKDENPF